MDGAVLWCPDTGDGVPTWHSREATDGFAVIASPRKLISLCDVIVGIALFEKLVYGRVEEAERGFSGLDAIFVDEVEHGRDKRTGHRCAVAAAVLATVDGECILAVCAYVGEAAAATVIYAVAGRGQFAVCNVERLVARVVLGEVAIVRQPAIS